MELFRVGVNRTVYVRFFFLCFSSLTESRRDRTVREGDFHRELVSRYLRADKNRGPGEANRPDLPSVTANFRRRKCNDFPISKSEFSNKVYRESLQMAHVGWAAQKNSPESAGNREIG